MLAADLRLDIRARLDGLLSKSHNPFFAIAFSGGGDSTALMHALAGHKACKAAFIVDHALRPKSREEAVAAKAVAEGLGYHAEILTWAHSNPKTGLQEKARKARYSLLGQACCSRGIPHLVTGHTRDDQAETLLMRYERGTQWRGAAGMAAAVYAPLWPELAGITLLRPMLPVSRHALRAYNRDNDLVWSEDPSNQNTDFTRIQTRQYLREHSELAADLIGTSHDLQKGREAERGEMAQRFKACARIDAEGLIYLDKMGPSRLLEVILQAAAGTGTAIPQKQLRALIMSMKSRDFKSSTLAGAKITAEQKGWVFSRDLGAVAGRVDLPKPSSVTLQPGLTLWDGRYWIETDRTDLTVKPFGQMRVRLSPERHAVVSQTPVFARYTLPAIVEGRRILAMGTRITDPDITVKSAVLEHVEGRLGCSLP